MNKRLLTPLAALTLVTFGCSEGNKLEQGEVIEKEYDDPDSYTTTQCAGYNSNGTCSMWMPVTHYDNEHYNLHVVGYDEDGKQRKEWHEVTLTLFDMVEVGDTVNFRTHERVPQ